MNPEENYCIKSAYRSRKETFSRELPKGQPYWTPERILMSRYHQGPVYRYCRRLIRESHFRSVVDVGCGTGWKLMRLLAPICKNAAGVDQQDAIAYCRARYPAAAFYADNLESPEQMHGPYDLIVCADVIEHLLDPDPLVAYLKRLSHDGSIIVLSTPERDVLRGRDCTGSDKPEHVREWNGKEFATYLQSRGLKIIKHRNVPFAGWGMSSAVRKERQAIQERCGTVETCQMAVCRLPLHPSRHQPGRDEN